MDRICLVDKDLEVLDNLCNVLKENSYEVDCFSNSLDAYEAIMKNNYDLLITALLMDDINGIQLIKLIKRTDKIIPIIITADSDNEEYELESINLDVAFYIKKPFSNNVFLLRIKKVLENSDEIRLTNKLHDLQENLVVLPKENLVQKDGIDVKLSRKEFEILLLLLNNKGTTISREDIIRKVWIKEPDCMDVRVIDVHIRNLRKKLNLLSLSTIYGYGYRWNK
ncbi:MAG: response regulator transcription factor [Bacilli bacterium]|jgi:two-component system response regulator VanR|nr:response regulator transcription factor [Bacilli bacterium]